MTALVAAVSILSCKPDVCINVSGVNSINLCDSSQVNNESYVIEKENYFEALNSHSESSQKVKENVKELQHLFSSYQCVHLSWEVQKPLLLFFNSGTVANVFLDEKTTKIKKISFDNSLCGKLPSSHLTDVIINDSCLLISYSEPKLTYVHFGKHSSLFNSKLLSNKKNKLMGLEPHISTFDLFLPSCRRLEKKLSLNTVKDYVLVWWRFSSSDVWPWMPVNQSVDHVSLLIYALNGNSLEVVCTSKIHGELQHASFSKWHSNRINTLEEIVKEGKREANICIYEVNYGTCHCMSVAKLPLNGHMTAFAWNYSEDKLLLSDDRMSLLVYDINSNTTLVASTLFVASDISWHPGGTLIAVAGSNGVLQCFDAALNSVKFHSFGRNATLNSLCLHTADIHSLKSVSIRWQNASVKQGAFCPDSSSTQLSDTVLMYFSSGVFAFFRFSFGCISRGLLSPLELIAQYLKYGNIDEAVCLLQSLSWCQQPELCFQCLSSISNYLLRKPLSLKSETALEHSLGTFYHSLSDLPDSVFHDYHQQVDLIARRFFHHLLRFHKFEKAYLLAVELRTKDLFLDLHHVAKQKKETVLAVISYKHAEQLDASYSSTCDHSSSDSDSCEDVAKDFQKTDVLVKGDHLPTTAKTHINSSHEWNSTMWTRKKQPNVPPEMCFESTKEYFSSQNSSSKNCDIATSKTTGNASTCDDIIPRDSSALKGTCNLALSRPLPDSWTNLKKINRETIYSYSDGVNEILEDEEEDVEGVPVKFYHFGVV